MATSTAIQLALAQAPHHPITFPASGAIRFAPPCINADSAQSLADR
ncbi:hypothetical protein QTH97_28340 [Variovorax sp. J22R24]|nr:hypothetical protein [Variovorax sp. J22R24]MDM0108882.1 hypothetical protein [Variovorax sp. J22R24]